TLQHSSSSSSSRATRASSRLGPGLRAQSKSLILSIPTTESGVPRGAAHVLRSSASARARTASTGPAAAPRSEPGSVGGYATRRSTRAASVAAEQGGAGLEPVPLLELTGSGRRGRPARAATRSPERDVEEGQVTRTPAVKPTSTPTPSLAGKKLTLRPPAGPGIEHPSTIKEEGEELGVDDDVEMAPAPAGGAGEGDHGRDADDSADSDDRTAGLHAFMESAQLHTRQPPLAEGGPAVLDDGGCADDLVQPQTAQDDSHPVTPDNAGGPDARGQSQEGGVGDGNGDTGLLDGQMDFVPESQEATPANAEPEEDDAVTSRRTLRPRHQSVASTIVSHAAQPASEPAPDRPRTARSVRTTVVTTTEAVEALPGSPTSASPAPRSLRTTRSSVRGRPQQPATRSHKSSRRAKDDDEFQPGNDDDDDDDEEEEEDDDEEGERKGSDINNFVAKSDDSDVVSATPRARKRTRGAAAAAADDDDDDDSDQSPVRRTRHSKRLQLREEVADLRTSPPPTHGAAPRTRRQQQQQQQQRQQKQQQVRQQFDITYESRHKPRRTAAKNVDYRLFHPELPPIDDEDFEVGGAATGAASAVAAGYNARSYGGGGAGTSRWKRQPHSPLRT
ncbi:hypothetical protein KEM52_002874, partial [Ascosphaera acerosa]